MSTFEPEFDGVPSEDEISEFLAGLGDDGPVNARRRPYDTFPASTRPRPDWRGGSLPEQDDQ